MDANLVYLFRLKKSQRPVQLSRDSTKIYQHRFESLTRSNHITGNLWDLTLNEKISCNIDITHVILPYMVREPLHRNQMRFKLNGDIGWCTS